jgi:hypothetical protein
MRSRAFEPPVRLALVGVGHYLIDTMVKVANQNNPNINGKLNK